MLKIVSSLFLSLLAFHAASASECAYPNLCEGTQTYTCVGPAVRGTILIRSLGFQPDYGRIRYTAISQLRIDGVPRTLRINNSQQEFGRTYVDSNGTWVPNRTQWIYAIGGADLGLDHQGRGFHLEVNHGGQGEIIGYMGHRDDSFPGSARLRFRCR